MNWLQRSHRVSQRTYSDQCASHSSFVLKVLTNNAWEKCENKKYLNRE